jgi:hypothetical protein
MIWNSATRFSDKIMLESRWMAAARAGVLVGSMLA